YLSIVRVVILKGDFKDLQRVTNAAVRTLFVDALAKNAQLQSSYGSGLEKIARLALLMSGDASLASKAESIDIKVKFHNPLPVDQTEISNINALAINAGYRSLRTAATELGDDWVFERAAIETEAEMKIKRELKRREALGEANGDDEPKPGTNPQAGIPPVGA